MENVKLLGLAIMLAWATTAIAHDTIPALERKETTRIQEVVVNTDAVARTRRQPYNVIGIDTKGKATGAKSLSDVLGKAPGVRVRETGGTGSDIQVLLDGFSGRHVKVFVDGVPQEGVGSSFGLNNIPVNFAERIEIFKGVVPVGFGTDAIGGVINVVTNKSRKPFWLDASYSYGSFNTHRTSVNLGQNLRGGMTWELTAFQNYSDNDYMVLAPVEDFTTGRIDRDKPEWVKRFHDMYHNEALVARFGFKDKVWADRLMFNMTYSQNYKDMQTGVRQDIVYGEKHRKSHSLMPGVEYVKRGAFGMGLDIMATANYNHNVTTNIDTAQYKYNWRGEKQKLNSPGEQSRQHSQAINSNFNTVLNLNYRFWRIHSITLNNTLNAFWRRNASLLAGDMTEEAIGKHTMKNILGAQYRVFPSEKWNMVAFAKWYHQSVSGPMATDANATSYVEYARGLDNLGYGIAATWFPLKGLQAKVSYEKASRLPTIEEMFGDEDLEMGSVDICPEKSHNLNVNLSYTLARRKHNLLLEGGFVFRDMNDYIQRNVVDLSGGKQAAAYTNYGKVRVMGWNLSARYGYSRWLSLGGNLTCNDVRDNMPTALGTTMSNISYGERMPNQPYLFADADIALTWNNCLAKGNSLTLQYENMYVHSFSYYSNHIGSGKSEYLVPMQFSHNIVLTYAIKEGRYNLSFECRNLTNALLYDNFRLQKPGRAFFGKVLIRI